MARDKTLDLEEEDAPLDDAPYPEEEGEESRDEEEAIARLDALGQTLFTYRKEAIEYRRISGIEEEWADAQDAYEGYDDANRPERDQRRAAWRSRPVGQTYPVEAGKKQGSTVFLNITRPYTDASAARVADMLFPTDDRPWGLSATPVPELSEATKSKIPVQLPGGQTATEGELVKQIIELADQKAERAEKRIDDWLTECQWPAQGRKVINTAARLGTGIIKGPVPKHKRKVKVNVVNGETQLEINESIVPGSKEVNPLNLFPAPDCGDDIHTGSYIWERDDITEKALAELRGLPGYIDSQIDAVIEEGPQMPETEVQDYAPRNEGVNTSVPYDIWYFTGMIRRDDLEAAGCDCSDMRASESIPAILTMVNHRVIRAATNPLDSGEFPYDVLVWQAREGFWAGMGVAHQISVPQRGVNAATRAMMNNAGITSGPQIVRMLGVVEPADGVDEVTPNKVWLAREDADIQQVQHAFMAINLDSNQGDLMAIIEFYLKMAEDVTGLPMMLQGQQGKAPELLGGMAMLQNNASTVLRRMARLFDDNITEPHIGRYYDWLLQHGDDPEEKGDFTIDARASSVLVERDIQNNDVIFMAQLSVNPAFGADPRKAYKELCQAKKLDYKRFQYTDDEWETIQENMSEQPEDPRIAVAQLKEQSDKQRMQFEERLKQLEMSWQGDQNERERALKAGLGELNAAVQSAANEGRNAISLDQIRGMLAGTAMTTQSKERLFDKERALKIQEGSGI